MAFPRFRFHLSTAVWLMFAAGGLIGLNLHGRFTTKAIPEKDGWSYGELRYGFPLSARIEKSQMWNDAMVTDEFAASFVKVYSRDKQWNVQYIRGEGIIFHQRKNPGEFIVNGILIDVLTALGIMLGVWGISEFWIRSRTKSDQTKQAAMTPAVE